MKLNLGCGPSRHKDYLGVDSINYNGYTDICADCITYLSSLEEGSIQAIYTSHFLEHIREPMEFFRLCHAKLIAGGSLEIVVPHFSNSWYHSDPTHKEGHPWGLYTISYLLTISSSYFKREVPSYTRLSKNYSFHLQELRIVFKSRKPRYILHMLQIVIGLLVNSSVCFQEAWEESLCWILPAKEVRMILVARDQQ